MVEKGCHWPWMRCKRYSTSHRPCRRWAALPGVPRVPGENSIEPLNYRKHIDPDASADPGGGPPACHERLDEASPSEYPQLVNLKSLPVVIAMPCCAQTLAVDLLACHERLASLSWTVSEPCRTLSRRRWLWICWRAMSAWTRPACARLACWRCRALSRRPSGRALWASRPPSPRRAPRRRRPGTACWRRCCWAA